MNKPSEEVTVNNKEGAVTDSETKGEKAKDGQQTSKQSGSIPKDVTEGIRLEGERVSVALDERKISDDYEDYIFLKPRGKGGHKSRRSGSSNHSHSHSDSDSSSDSELVASTRSNSHHHKRRKKKKMRTWKKILIAVVATILALVLIIIGTGFFLVLKGQTELFDNNLQILAPYNVEATVQDDGKYIVYNGNTYELNENITSLLFMGVDKRDLEDEGDNNTSGQSDLIVLMAIDTKNGKTSLISIPRDTITDVAVYSVNGAYTEMTKTQICLAYAYGDGMETSCENVIASVRRIFYNMPIKSYFAIDLDGISALNDSIGGVDVVSPETIETFIEGQQYHLEGNSAERFVRARRHDRADASMLRLKRQQTYAENFMQKMIAQTKANLMAPVDLFNASSPYSCTNLDASKIAYFAKELVTGGGMKMEMTTIPGKVSLNEKEYAEYNIDEQSFYELFLNTYYNKM